MTEAELFSLLFPEGLQHPPSACASSCSRGTGRSCTGRSSAAATSGTALTKQELNDLIKDEREELRAFLDPSLKTR